MPGPGNGARLLFPHRRPQGGTIATSRIALYPGDGIGVDVTREVVRVLEAVQRRDRGLVLEMETVPWGCVYHD